MPAAALCRPAAADKPSALILTEPHKILWQ